MTAADGLLVAALGPEGRVHSAPLQRIGASLGGLLLGGALALTGTPGWQQSLTLVVAIGLFCALPALALAPFSDPAGGAASDPHSLFIHGGIGLLMGYLSLLQVDAGMSIAQIALLGMVLTHAVDQKRMSASSTSRPSWG